MKLSLTTGLTVLAAAAVLEAALIPGLLIGGAAVLAPQLLPRLQRKGRAGTNTSNRRSGLVLARERRMSSKAAPVQGPTLPFSGLLPRLAIEQAIAKTITYRMIVTTLDFSTNYVVIGELATAVGLSSFNLVAGPLSYLVHEAAWNCLSPSQVGVTFDGAAGFNDAAGDEKAAGSPLPGLPISRVLAKTITFRTMATVMDFTANYVVVRDVATAAVLSASGFVLGPFVYYGHEKAWDYFGKRFDGAADRGQTGLLPAPAWLRRRSSPI